jgi:energy-converting hydrogenase A subunit M
MRDAAPVQEPVAWKWHQAPVKTSWGHEMVVADLAIDKDHTVSVYCERDQITKVEAMFSTPPEAQRQWVGLTDEEVMQLAFNFDVPSLVIRTAENQIKEKNT